jgi:predicted acylesterase/phospholipase RssA
MLALTAKTEEIEAGAKCYALAFSSGDETSAYQAGAISGIANSKLSPDQYAYDSVSGVSGGAINAVIMSNYTKGQEKAAAERMEQFWRDASNAQLYKGWFGGIARGLFFEGGLYNSAPLEKFLTSEFGGVKLQRSVDLGIVDVVTGAYKEFSTDNITAGQNLHDALYASLSFSGFFPPADVLDSYYFDGSAVWDIDIFSAINRCKDKGFQNTDIVVDVVLTSSANLKEVDATDYKSIQMLFRYLEISSFYNSMDGLLRAKFAYQGVNWRYAISPTSAIPSSLKPLNMNEKDMEGAFAAGVKDATDAINNKVTIDDLIHYHALKKSGQHDIRGHTYGSFIEAKKNGDFENYDIMQDPYMRKYTYKIMQD